MSPSLAIIVSTLLWGTWWIPLRQLDGGSTGGVWANALGLLLPLALLLPIALYRWRRLYEGGWPLLALGFFTAAAVVLYAEGLVRGAVAHVMLLFYLTPIWSTLLGRCMLGEPVTPRRVSAVVLGLGGVAIIVGFDSGHYWPQTAAEWMGLLSGVLWALAMVYVRDAEGVAAIDKTVVVFAFLGALFVALNALPGGRGWGEPLLAQFDAIVWLAVFAFIWTLPVIALTMYGASYLDPGRVAILLMLEIVIGLLSAALLAGEPFGVRETLGGVLIIAAGGSDLFAPRTRSSRRSASL